MPSLKTPERIINTLLIILFLNTCLCFAEPAEVIAEDINLRTDSRASSEIICTVGKNTVVEVITEAYEWYKIRLPDYAPAYVKKELFECLEDREGCQKAKALKSGINVRLSPDLSSAIVGMIDEEETVTVLKEEEGWYKITPPKNSYGWIHRRFLKITP
ncbi:MAG: SH3 domain-containing protein [Candidatus Omnitrophica bacterium]|nr:SH3 domain-containing protein [Candidatus Omnitrophota bacterium]